MEANKKIKKEPKAAEVATLASFQKMMDDKSPPPPILDELNLRLFVAVMLGTPSEVTKVIKEGADVNALNLNQVCPLELAVAYKRKNVIKILEANGAHLQPAKAEKNRPSKKH